MAFEHNIIFWKKIFLQMEKIHHKKRAEIKPLNDTYHLKIFICDYTKCQNHFEVDIVQPPRNKR
jgi:hypothetical protein